MELWPEFGAHGKETATVRHALTHSADFAAAGLLAEIITKAAAKD